MPHTTRAVSGAANLAARRPVAVARADAAGIERAPAAHTNGTLLTIREECVGHRVVLLLDGEVDISNAAALRVAIENAGTRAFEVWLDLSATTFMDSSALQAMAEARLRLTEANRRLALVCPQRAVLRALTLTGFDRIFAIHASRSAANHATLA